MGLVCNDVPQQFFVIYNQLKAHSQLKYTFIYNKNKYLVTSITKQIENSIVVQLEQNIFTLSEQSQNSSKCFKENRQKEKNKPRKKKAQMVENDLISSIRLEFSKHKAIYMQNNCTGRASLS